MPFVIAALILAMTAANVGFDIYSTNQVTKAADAYNSYVGDFYGGSKEENAAYWSRYIRAHHLDLRDVKFPYRSGMIFNESQLYAAGSRNVSNEYARYGSLVHGATSLGRSAALGSLYSSKK